MSNNFLTAVNYYQTIHSKKRHFVGMRFGWSKPNLILRQLRSNDNSLDVSLQIR